MRQYQQVASSNLEGVYYEAPSRRLYVKFKLGVEYYYSDVPSEIYDGLLAADSKGKYLNQFVKGTYAYQKAPLLDTDNDIDGGNFDVVNDHELVLTEADVADDAYFTATNDPMRGAA